MNKRQARKIVNNTLLVTVVDEYGMGVGVAVLGSHSKDLKFRAMRKLGVDVDGINWYKEEV